LLWALSFLKTGDTFNTLASRFQVAEKTFRSWTWQVLETLYEMMDEVD